MKPVKRDELLGLEDYEKRRPESKATLAKIKGPRRIHVGTELTFLFENHDTVWYQVQEMMRSERMVHDKNINHELETYNELLGGPGELGCTLLIEIVDPVQRDIRLKKLVGLMQHIFLRLEDASLVRPQFDKRQIGDERLSSVQFLKFDVKGNSPNSLGTDHADLKEETIFTPEQREALGKDLEQN